MSKIKISLATILMLYGIVFFTIVAAQEPRRGETITDRARSDLDARGIQLGAFRALPAIDINVLSDDNIYASTDSKIDDLITEIKPEFVVEADWSRAKLELGTNLAVGRYADFDTEDYEDWRTWGNLGMDLGRGRLLGEVRHEELHEWRTSADDKRGIEPTEFTVDSWSLAYRNRFGLFGLHAKLSEKQLAFEDTETLTGPDSNKDRDRERIDLRIRTSYDRSPRFQPFLEFGLTEVNFDQIFDDNGFQRSSYGYDVVGGTMIDLSGQTFGEVFLGYINREYDDERFLTIDGPVFGGQITWNVSGLTTMQFSADRLIKSTTIVGASGITDTGFGMEIDHELLRDLVLSFDISFNNEDFEGIDRSDDIFHTQLEGLYMMNRYLRLRLGINILNRDTSPADSGGREFDKQQIYFGIQSQI